jgi:hypothetical protein
MLGSVVGITWQVTALVDVGGPNLPVGECLTAVLCRSGLEKTHDGRLVGFLIERLFGQAVSFTWVAANAGFAPGPAPVAHQRLQ